MEYRQAELFAMDNILKDIQDLSCQTEDDLLQREFSRLLGQLSDSHFIRWKSDPEGTQNILREMVALRQFTLNGNVEQAKAVCRNLSDMISLV